MTPSRISAMLKNTPLRILLPSVMMLVLFAGSIFLILLPSLHDSFMRHKEETSRTLTESVISNLTQLDRKVDNGELSLEQAQSLAIEVIRGTRYGVDGKDYFWINDTTPRMVMHPYRSELEGEVISEVKDKTGRILFQEFVTTAKKGGGFVDYDWQWQDQPDRITQKRSYVRYFEPWGWIVGTGIYLDNVKAEVATYRNRIGMAFGVILLVITLLTAYVLRQATLTEQKTIKAQTQRERLMQALREGEERYRTIADFAHDWEAWIGMTKNILYCSPSCERITGHPPEHFFESPGLIRNMILAEDLAEWDEYQTKVATADGMALDFRIHHKNGDLRWLNVVGQSVSGIGDKPLGVRYSFRDITERKRMEELLRHQALHDPLTGLANRTLCLDRIKQAMQRAQRRDSYYFAVIFLDLDRFKVINDSLGHRCGDLVLMETSSRLKKHVRSLDTVSRFGGDEFVLLLDELATPGEAIRIIKRIRTELAKPFLPDGHKVQTTASMGIVLSPIGDISSAEVLQNANIAMHKAKEAGRNRFKVFTGRMLENAVQQLTMENDMRRGLQEDEFSVEYQPIMHVDGSDLMGFEALARWHHPERGLIPPAEFIPMAEESGMILELGEWVLNRALQTLAEWRKSMPGNEDVFITVNLSSKQFARMELDKIVLGALSNAGLPPETLKLEITETAIMDHPDAAVHILKRLRRAGIRFSIDDFGTGYSSLTQLQKLPVDTIKVDRSFVSRMKQDPENMEIVKAVIALAHSLDLDVVAEGVEGADQLCSLLDLRCECVQGFYFHRPLPTQKAEELLRKRGTSDTDQQELARLIEECRGKSAQGT